MNPALQLRVQRYGWDRAEPFYEKGWKRSLRPAQDVLLKMADLSTNEKVLDVSCGTGIVSFEAVKKVGEEGYVMGIDISEKMIGTAAQKAFTLGFRNIYFARMEAEKLDFVDHAFNVVLNALGMMYYPTPKQAVREMNRVLKTGGRAISAIWGARENCGWAEIFPIVDARVKTAVCPLFFQLGTENTLAKLYESIGFKEVESVRINTVMHYYSDDDALNAVFAGGPVAMAYSRFDEATKKAVHKEYLNSIAAYKNNEGYFIPGEFVVVKGVKE